MIPAIASAAAVLALWYATLFTSAWEKSPALEAFVEWVVRSGFDRTHWRWVFLAVPVLIVTGSSVSAFHVVWTITLLLR